MFPVLDFNSIQNFGGSNVAFQPLKMYSLTSINETIFYICIGYYFFATAKLIIYYVFHKYDGSYVRTVLKSIFYLYLILLVSMTVSYLFLIIRYAFPTHMHIYHLFEIRRDTQDFRIFDIHFSSS